MSKNLARCDRKVKNEPLCSSFPLSEVALLPVFKSVECYCLLVEKRFPVIIFPYSLQSEGAAAISCKHFCNGVDNGGLPESELGHLVQFSF